MRALVHAGTIGTDAGARQDARGRIVRCLASQGGRLSLACATAMQKASDALIAAGVTMNPGLISQ
jgi:hypothetical protein